MPAASVYGWFCCAFNLTAKPPAGPASDAIRTDRVGGTVDADSGTSSFTMTSGSLTSRSGHFSM